MKHAMHEYGEEEPIEPETPPKESLSAQAEVLRVQISAMKNVKSGVIDAKKLLSLTMKLHDVEIQRKIARLERELRELRSGDSDDLYLGVY